MKKTIQPYLFIAACGILAFAPVSFMILALKNDIIALEYPINHFISQCIRNGEFPVWFNTWGMGFPLESSLTWGVFSTPRLFFSAVFDYNIYSLHVEFMFYVMMAGWGMFFLLKNHLCKDEKIALLLSLCYMLSGFMSGSTQWLLYITAAAFIPLVIASLLKLLHSPSFGNSLQFAICYVLMLTSVYAAFNIITSYCIIVFVLIWLWNKSNNRHETVKYILIAAALTFLLCLPCLYYTIEVLNNLDRGSGLESSDTFFNSNYLHPGALSSMLLPFSSVKMGYSNTEGTMLNTYAGLLTLMLLPMAVWHTVKTKNRVGGLLLLFSLFFLIVSLGEITPLRRLLNILPGFSYFRNPAIFRFFFIFTLLIFLATLLGNYKFENILEKRISRLILWIAGLLCLTTLLFHIADIDGLFENSFYDFVKNITYSRTLLVSALIQLVLISLLLIFLQRKKWKLAVWLFAAELVINTLICTPFFSVSSYTPSQVMNILNPVKGFPIQIIPPSEVPTTLTDENNNSWQNINTFQKEVSSLESYLGPLILKKQIHNDINNSYTNKQLVFIRGDSVNAKVNIQIQRPGHIRAITITEKPDTVMLLQNYYKGWKVLINNKETEIIQKQRPGIAVLVPAGKNNLDFRYEKNGVRLSAIFVHLVVVLFIAFRIIGRIRRFRSASLS